MKLIALSLFIWVLKSYETPHRNQKANRVEDSTVNKNKKPHSKQKANPHRGSTVIRNKKQRRLTKKQLKAFRNKMWEHYFRKTDKLVTNYNTLYDDDFLINHMGKTGSEIDPAYPEYFNQKLSYKKLNKIHRKVYRLRNRKFDDKGNPIKKVLPMRYECVKFRKIFRKSCNIYRELLQVEPSAELKRLAFLDRKRNAERLLRQIKLKSSVKKHHKADSFAHRKHKHSRIKRKMRVSKARHIKRQKRHLIEQDIIMPPIKPEGQMEASEINVTTFARIPPPQHTYIADPEKPKTNLIVPRFYLSSDTFRPVI